MTIGPSSLLRERIWERDAHDYWRNGETHGTPRMGSAAMSSASLDGQDGQDTAMAAHDPEVAGSNPVLATRGNGPSEII